MIPAARAVSATVSNPTSLASRTVAVFTEFSIAVRTVMSPEAFPSKFWGVHSPWGVLKETGAPETIVESVVRPCPRAASESAARRTNGLNALPGCRLAFTARLNWVVP